MGEQDFRLSTCRDVVKGMAEPLKRALYCWFKLGAHEKNLNKYCWTAAERTGVPYEVLRYRVKCFFMLCRYDSNFRPF